MCTHETIIFTRTWLVETPLCDEDAWLAWLPWREGSFGVFGNVSSFREMASGHGFPSNCKKHQHGAAQKVPTTVLVTGHSHGQTHKHSQTHIRMHAHARTRTRTQLCKPATRQNSLDDKTFTQTYTHTHSHENARKRTRTRF
jgi:hypothetical protein